jgi:rare lipoprotein A
VTRRHSLRESRLARAAVGASMLAAPASAAAFAHAPRPHREPAEIQVRARAIRVHGQGMINVRGTLLPAAADRRVELQALRTGRWVRLAVARTGPRGRFDLRYRASGLGRRRLRVRFAGDAVNASAHHRAGTLTVYRQTAASWYDDGGATACGFHAHYGVASPSLPCGARVSFQLAGRNVTAVVDDRGPFVGGRAWDLNQNTAAALGVGGVETVWSSS